MDIIWWKRTLVLPMESRLGDIASYLTFFMDLTEMFSSVICQKGI